MDITLNKKTNTDASIKVTLNEADYQSKVDEKLKDYSKKAQIKGFRPGKVPPSLIRKMYGKSILVEQISTILDENLKKYIKENKLPIVGEPLPDNEHQRNIDWDNQSNFEFEYNVGLHSEFDYDLSKLNELPKYVVKVDDKEVEETLDRLRTQYGKMEPVEAPSQKEDYLHGEIKSEDGSFTQSVALPINKIEESEAAAFNGVTKDQVLTFDIQKIFGGDESRVSTFLGVPKEEIESLGNNFEFKITEIRRTQPADLNQEFFDLLFGKDAVSTEEDFRSKVKETLQKNFSADAEALLSRHIYKALLENTQIELPEEFLKEYLFIINQGKFAKEDIDKDFDLYKDEIKWGLIRNKIVKDKEIKVGDNDLKEEARKVMRNRLSQLGGAAAGMEQLIDQIADNYLKADNGKNVNSLLEGVLLEKVLSFVRENITVTEKEISKEEFTKLAQN